MSSYDVLANMQVQVRLFARYRELAGTGSLCIEVPVNSTALDVFDRVAASYPDMQPMRTSTLMAVDQEFVKPNTELRDGEELALMPPVSGGSAPSPSGRGSLDSPSPAAAGEGRGQGPC